MAPRSHLNAALHTCPSRELELGDLHEAVRKGTGMCGLVATGIRRIDDFKALRVVREVGPINRPREWWFPLWDWNPTRVYDQVLQEGCGLPVDYELLGRSFPGVNHRTLAALKGSAYHDDYERIVELFPLSVLDTFRREIS